VKRHLNKFIFLVFAPLVLGGCSFQGGLNTTYYQYAAHAYTTKIPGKGAIEMSAADQKETFTGKPTSFTGGGSTLTLPLGQITMEAAKLAFNDVFTQGVQVVESVPTQGYVATIRPKVTQYSYEYNQLKNVGFAITPTAVLTLDVTLRDGAGQTVWQKKFESGVYEGPAYMMSGSPGEEISKTTHRAIMKVMQDAADEVQKEMVVRVKANGGQGQSL
jgi:hypothetical protein